MLLFCAELLESAGGVRATPMEFTAISELQQCKELLASISAVVSSIIARTRLRAVPLVSGLVSYRPLAGQRASSNVPHHTDLDPRSTDVILQAPEVYVFCDRAARRPAKSATSTIHARVTQDTYRSGP